MKTWFLAFCVLSLQTVFASQAPPFGSSITWNTSREDPSLEALRGKAVLVVFFQSWCPLCNNWSGTMFKGLTEAFKDNPKVVLVALKTDGGSVRDALGYLKGRMDTDRWLIGTDSNATYARQLTGRDRLYTYAWITPDGQISESGKAGSAVSGSNPKVYWAARNDAQKRYVQPARTLIDFSASVSAPLQPAILRAEQGLFATALRELQPLSTRAELREEVARVREAIAAAVQASIDRHSGLLADATNRDRYFSFLALTDIAGRFGGSPIAQAARNGTSTHASASWLSREQTAHRAYESLMRKASRANDDRAIERITKSLQEFGQTYQDTLFGRLASKATDAEETES